MTLVSAVNLSFSLFTIIAQAIILLNIISFFINRNKKIISFFSKKAFFFSLIISLTATIGSFFYSEITDFEPCKLCWLQRIFMYPQIIILSAAILTKKNEKIITYISLILSIIGIIIAGYHYLYQLNIAPEFYCSKNNYSSISCSQVFVKQFGYITIPMMSLTAFSFIVVLMIFRLKNKQY